MSQIEINLRWMRYFLAVASEGSFTRAAHRLQIDRSGLFRLIHEMENRLDVKLFERFSNGPQLTPAGKLFEAEAAKAIEHSNRAVELVSSLAREGNKRLRIGVSSFCDLPRIQGLIETCRRSTPQFLIEQVTARSRELLSSLLRGKLDLAFLDMPVRGEEIEATPVISESLAVILPRKHPLSERPIVRLFELRKERIILVSTKNDPGSVALMPLLEGGEIESSFLNEAADPAEVMDRVALGQGVGILRISASRFQREGIIFKPLWHSYQLQTAIAWRKDIWRVSALSFRDTVLCFSEPELRQDIERSLKRPGVVLEQSNTVHHS